MLVHHAYEIRFAASDRLGKSDRDIIGGTHKQRLKRPVDGELGTFRQPDFARRLDLRIERVGNFAVELELTILDGVEHHVTGHQLGQRGRIPRFAGVIGMQHRSRFHVENKRRPGNRLVGNNQQHQSGEQQSQHRL